VSPITHFLISWVVLEQLQVSQRDKAIVVIAGITPDLDGLGIVIDFATKTLGLVETDYYQSFHRMYGHGLPAALCIAVLASAVGTSRYRVAFWAFVSVHLHFLGDLLGSRGSTVEDIWGIYYFMPLTMKYEISWAAQWPLVGWQNLVLTAVLLAIVMKRATIRGYSPLGLLSTSADTIFLSTLRVWQQRWASRFSGRK